jgi:hypothetical protein
MSELANNLVETLPKFGIMYVNGVCYACEGIGMTAEEADDMAELANSGGPHD